MVDLLNVGSLLFYGFWRDLHSKIMWIEMNRCHNWNWNVQNKMKTAAVAVAASLWKRMNFSSFLIPFNMFSVSANQIWENESKIVNRWNFVHMWAWSSSTNAHSSKVCLTVTRSFILKPEWTIAEVCVWWPVHIIACVYVNCTVEYILCIHIDTGDWLYESANLQAANTNTHTEK